MELPNVPITAQAMIDEMTERITGLMIANVRLTCMIHEITGQRDRAMKLWEEEKNKNVHGDSLVHR